MSKEYETRDTCFICSSPYQIIGAINISIDKGIESDLYITGEFPGYEKVAEKIGKYNLFHDIYLVDKKSVTGRGKLASLKMTLFANRAISSYMPNNISYRNYYASSRSTLKATQLGVLRKRNPNIRRIVYEDGLGSYTNNDSIFTASTTRRAIEKLLGWDLDNPKLMSIMVYLPELLNVPKNLNAIRIEKMPRIDLRPEYCDMLSDIFSVNETNCIREKYIIFDVKRRGGELDHRNKEEKDLLDRCYKIIRDQVGDDIICKPHPKSVERTSCNISQYKYKGTPMEALYLNMSDLEERVLISHVSTAVFTPKILFDSEPTIICLHKILKDNYLSKVFEATFTKFSSTYHSKNKVFAPNSIEELVDIIKMLS